ncbi:MAG: hypothetical protein IBJ00_05380 [Alphaproteobacteria bacterium]|nr:hypothetical protein [Alphaproteobacteria bacterium]
MPLSLINLTVVSVLTIIIGRDGYATQPSSSPQPETTQDENDQNKKKADQTPKDPTLSEEEKRTEEDLTFAKKLEKIIQYLIVDPSFFIPAM